MATPMNTTREAVAVPLWEEGETADSTGGQFWCCAQLLACCCANDDDPLRVRGRRVLELGGGTGALAIAIARAGATRVLSTDVGGRVHDMAAAFSRENAPAGALEARELWFGERDGTEVFDLVVASELLYWPALSVLDDDTLVPLVATLRAVCSRTSFCPALLAFKVRDQAREARFFDLTADAGFVVAKTWRLTVPPDFRDPDPPGGPTLADVRCVELHLRR